MTKLYITHPEFNFQSMNKNSKLLDNVNIELTESEYHTSLGDLKIHELLSIVHKFQSIEFIEENFIDGDDITKDTLNFIRFVRHKVEPTELLDLEISSFADHEDIKKRTSNKLLWVYGCSHSYGTGLNDSTETYGSCLSKELNLPLNLIAKPGSSTHWSLRQLINSDLKKDDYVVWQITSPYRLSYFNGKHVQEIALSNCNSRSIIDSYTDEQCFFLQLSYLNIGVQYLNSIGVKFTILSVDNREMNLNFEYSKYPEYYCATNFVVDYGSDNLHFGPLSHKKLAIDLANHIKCLYV